MYALVHTVPKKILHNEMYSANWLERHCRAVGRCIGHGHDERKLIKPLRAASVSSNPKRKRGD